VVGPTSQCSNLIFDEETYTYICLDTGEVIFDALETTVIQGDARMQFRKTRTDDFYWAQTFTISATLLCDYGQTVGQLPETKVYFEVSSDGLKAKLWRYMRCPTDKRPLRISWLSIDFTDPHRMLIKRLVIDTKHSGKYTKYATVLVHEVTFNYLDNKVPPEEVRRLAVSAAVVMAFAVYAGLNTKSKAFKKVNRQHRSIAAAAAYVLYRAGYLRPYVLNKGKIVGTSNAVLVDGKQVNRGQVTSPWNNMKDSSRDAVKASLQYLANVAKSLSQQREKRTTKLLTPKA